MSRKVFAIPLVVLCLFFALVPVSAATSSPGDATKTTTFSVAAGYTGGVFREPVSRDGDGVPLEINLFDTASKPALDGDCDRRRAVVAGMVAQPCAEVCRDVEWGNNLAAARRNLDASCSGYGNRAACANNYSLTNNRSRMATCSSVSIEVLHEADADGKYFDVNLVNTDFQLPPASNGALGLSCGASGPRMAHKYDTVEFLRGTIDNLTL